jgi:hypothetical protein
LAIETGASGAIEGRGIMALAQVRLQPLREAGGWRRLFIAGTALLAIASFAWAWHDQAKAIGGARLLELALSLWAIGAAALGILVAGLAAIDRSCVWVGRGFGLPPAVARAGAAAVLAGLTFLGGFAALTRYETVMPEGGAMRTGELCIVLDRWTGAAKPCTEEAIIRRERKRSEPQRTEAPSREETLWQRVVELVVEFMDAHWLPAMTGRA